MTIPITKTIPGSLGTLLWGQREESTGWDILVKSVLRNTGLNDAGTVLLSLGKRVGSCLYQPSCLGGMEGLREKLTPVGQEGATCLDFKCIPFHASIRTSWPLCVQNLDLIWWIFLRHKCHWILLTCWGVGSMASFRNYADTLNCVLVSQCQENSISRLGRLGRNFWCPCEGSVLLWSQRECVLAKMSADLLSPCVPSLTGDISLDSHPLGGHILHMVSIGRPA